MRGDTRVGFLLGLAVVFLPILSAPAVARNSSDLLDQAYSYNREGMIAMSKAQFKEAIDQFQQAAELVPDYGITHGDLRYTPNFMIAWAYEKLGEWESACQYFQRFLNLAPAEWQDIETEKTDHAGAFLDTHCPSLSSPREPWL